MQLIKYLFALGLLCFLFQSCSEDLPLEDQDSETKHTIYNANSNQQGGLIMTNQDFFDPLFSSSYLDLDLPENTSLKPGAESILNEIFTENNSDALATFIVNKVGVPVWVLGIEDDNDDGSFFIVPLVDLESKSLKGILVKNESTTEGIRLFNYEKFKDNFDNGLESHVYLDMLFSYLENILKDIRSNQIVSRSGVNCNYYDEFKGGVWVQGCACNGSGPWASCITIRGCDNDCAGDPIGGEDQNGGEDNEGGPKTVAAEKFIYPISNITGGFLPNINTAWETLGLHFGNIEPFQFGEDGTFGVNYPPNWDIEEEADNDNDGNIDLKDPMELLEDQLSVFTYLFGLEDRYDELLETLIDTGLGQNIQDYEGFSQYMRYILIQEIEQIYYNSQMDESHKWWIFDNFEKYPMVIDYLKGYLPGVPSSPATLKDFIDLVLANSNLNITESEMVHLLTFESNLIQDIDAFFGDNPASPYRYNIVSDFIELQTCGNTLPCVPIDLSNEFGALNDFYEYTSYDNRAWVNKSENNLHKNQIQWNLIKFGEDDLAKEFIDDHLTSLRENPEYKAFVESTMGWSGVMWSIAKELIGDKVIDVIVQFIPGFGNADEIRDAIKAFKNGDWVEFTVEVGKIVVNNTPLGKLLKTWDVVDDLYDFYYKVEKVWDKIGTYAENVAEQMWTIIKNYPKALRTNTDLIGGIAKTIKRGLKTVDEVMDAIPNFNKMSNARMKHILHGDTGGGLHHVSGLVNDPSKKVIEIVSPNSKGVYKVRYEYVDVNGNIDTKLSTMFPDTKSEIQVAKSIENVFNNPNIDNLIENGTQRLLKGVDSTGIPIEIITDTNYNIITAFPIFN